MKFWNKDLKEKANKRVSKTDTSELVIWMDTALMGLNMQFDSWRAHKGDPSLISESLTVLSSIWEELNSRQID